MLQHVWCGCPYVDSCNVWKICISSHKIQSFNYPVITMKKFRNYHRYMFPELSQRYDAIILQVISYTINQNLYLKHNQFHWQLLTHNLQNYETIYHLHRSEAIRGHMDTHYWIILLALSCLWSHNTRHIINKSLMITANYNHTFIDHIVPAK